jgi:hypothetical protein
MSIVLDRLIMDFENSIKNPNPFLEQIFTLAKIDKKYFEYWKNENRDKKFEYCFAYYPINNEKDITEMSESKSGLIDDFTYNEQGMIFRHEMYKAIQNMKLDEKYKIQKIN